MTSGYVDASDHHVWQIFCRWDPDETMTAKYPKIPVGYRHSVDQSVPSDTKKRQKALVLEVTRPSLNADRYIPVVMSAMSNNVKMEKTLGNC